MNIDLKELKKELEEGAPDIEDDAPAVKIVSDILFSKPADKKVESWFVFSRVTTLLITVLSLANLVGIVVVLAKLFSMS